MSDALDDFARSTRRSRRIRLIVLGLVCASPLIWVTYRLLHTRAVIAEHEEEYRKENALDAAQTAELHELLAAAKVTIATTSKSFREDVTPAALQAVAASAAPCPVELSGPSRAAARGYAEHGSYGGDFGNVSFTINAPGQPIDPGLNRVASSIAWIEERLAKDDPSKHELEQARELAGGLGNVLFLVGRTDPGSAMPTGYTSGGFSGVAYLYSPRGRKIICTMDVDVANSADLQIKFSYQVGNEADRYLKADEATKAALERDLMMQLKMAIAHGLRATAV